MSFWFFKGGFFGDSGLWDLNGFKDGTGQMVFRTLDLNGSSGFGRFFRTLDLMVFLGRLLLVVLRTLDLIWFFQGS